MANLARHYRTKITYVSLTNSAHRFAAHSPKNYKAKLGEFAKNQADRHKFETASQWVISHEPSGELDPTLLTAASEISAGLIVMHSHIPVLADLP